MSAVVMFSIGMATVNAQELVVPDALEFVEGNIGNCFPLTGCGEHRRYQQVYASSGFDELTTSVLITALRFRPDGESAPLTNTSFANMQIRMSTTQKTPPSNQPPGPSPVAGELSATFADNVGPDEAIVYSGPLVLMQSVVGETPPYDFDLVIELKTPFLYNPMVGNLLVEFRNYSGESFFGQFADAHNAPCAAGSIGCPTVGIPAADAIGRVYTNNINSPNDPEGPIGSVDTWGLVTKFTYMFPTGLTLEDIPVEPGENQPTVNVPNFFVQVADNVGLIDPNSPGTVDASFCVGHDPRFKRYTRRGRTRTRFENRAFKVSEMSDTGSCGDLSHLKEIVPAMYRGYPGIFPADGTGSPGEWFVIGDIQAENLFFDGPLVAAPVAESLIDFTDPSVTPYPPVCNTDLPWRQLILGGDFEDGQKVMTVDSVQCNGPRSMTRRTTYLYPARLDSTRRTQRLVELLNMERHFVTLGQGIDEIKSCAANETVAEIWENLLYAQLAFLFRRYDESVGYFEQIAFAAKNGNFNGCSAVDNNRGRFISDALSGALSVYDRYLHSRAGSTWSIYLIPAGLELPLVLTDEVEQ